MYRVKVIEVFMWNGISRHNILWRKVWNIAFPWKSLLKKKEGNVKLVWNNSACKVLLSYHPSWKLAGLRYKSAKYGMFHMHTERHINHIHGLAHKPWYTILFIEKLAYYKNPVNPFSFNGKLLGRPMFYKKTT